MSIPPNNQPKYMGGQTVIYLILMICVILAAARGASIAFHDLGSVSGKAKSCPITIILKITV
jgi:hypothetical protein